MFPPKAHGAFSSPRLQRPIPRAYSYSCTQHPLTSRTLVSLPPVIACGERTDLAGSVRDGVKIPVFFLRDESDAVHTENGEGLFFMSPGDAKEKLKELKGAEGTKVW